MSGNRDKPAQTPVKTGDEPRSVKPASTSDEIAAFVTKARALGPLRADGKRGRLVFALDATMSRQPTWDTACQIQAEMFQETSKIGGLDVQLVYFRGFGECRASRWVKDSSQLAGLMTGIDCRGGYTQIGKVLTHVLKESKKQKVDALVYVGDCLEEEIDALSNKAGELGLLGVPAFIFQEGHEPNAERGFREIARLTKGAYCRFDSGARDQLRELLSAVAVFVAGGHKALSDRSKSSTGARRLIEQMN